MAVNRCWKQRTSSTRAIIVGFSLGLGTTSAANAGVRDYAVEASAVWQATPTSVDFAWPADPAAEQYYIYKRLPGEAGWGSPLDILPGYATGFSDLGVSPGLIYEYSFRKSLAAVEWPVLDTGRRLRRGGQQATCRLLLLR